MANSNVTGKLGENPEFMQLFGSAPHLNLTEKRHCRAKLFKSGNSLAVRIPARHTADNELLSAVPQMLYLLKSRLRSVSV